MGLITCPGCGKQISDAAPACIHCGLPRGLASDLSGGVAVKRTGPWAIVLIVIAVGFAFVFVVGILAAIAIPRFAVVARAAKEAEAETVLKQVAGLEAGYHDQAGAYTSDLSRLQGYALIHPAFYSLSVSQASDSRLCIDALPRETSERLVSQSIDQDGRIYKQAGCGDSGYSEMDEQPGDRLKAPAVEGSATEPEPPVTAPEEPAPVDKPHKH
jgi:Tfp pilus assembly protein PilE